MLRQLKHIITVGGNVMRGGKEGSQPEESERCGKEEGGGYEERDACKTDAHEQLHIENP